MRSSLRIRILLDLSIGSLLGWIFPLIALSWFSETTARREWMETSPTPKDHIENEKEETTENDRNRDHNDQHHSLA